MRRREFISVAGGAAMAMLSRPVRARQSNGLPVVGYLDAAGLPRWFEAFRQGLSDLGYVPGRTIVIEHRSGAGQVELLPGLAAELVRLQPDVIVSSTSPAALAAKNVTANIPIVFAFATDPIGLGLVSSLAHPGGNITGQSNYAPGLVGKRLQLLAEMLPGVSHFGVVWSPSFAANHADILEVQAAARESVLTISSFEVARPADFDGALREAATKTKGVLVLSGPMIFANRDKIVAAAMSHNMPAIYYDTEYAEAGGLASYGPSLAGLHRSAAVFVDKILRGAKPADLPVEQPTRFSLALNMKAAQTLGYVFPPAILARADTVIE